MPSRNIEYYCSYTWSGFIKSAYWTAEWQLRIRLIPGFPYVSIAQRIVDSTPPIST